jgi:hypothetical protein
MDVDLWAQRKVAALVKNALLAIATQMTELARRMG